MKEEFLRFGFSHLDRLLSPEEVAVLRDIYDELLKDPERTKGLRSDLAGADGGTIKERITQVMRPSLVHETLQREPVYAKALAHARELLGPDMELDFDMMIHKAPFTDTPTPWHQDAAYWIDLPDKRAVTIWVALDDVFEENGCMWFLPRRTDDYVHPHLPLPGKGALHCDIDTEGAIAVPISAGGCTFHDGYTPHYSRGNSTATHRRVLILNFRPATMIRLERQRGMDHTGDRAVRQGK